MPKLTEYIALFVMKKEDEKIGMEITANALEASLKSLLQ